MASGIPDAPFTFGAGGNRLSGGGGGAGDGSGSGINLCMPPSNMTITRYPAVAPGTYGGTNVTTQAGPPTAFLVTLGPPVKLGVARVPTISYRIYYLSVNEVHQTSGNPDPNLDQSFVGPRLYGVRHPVPPDIPASGNPVTVSIPALQYLAGGWFYAVGVNSAGFESAMSTSMVQLPVVGYIGIPANEVSGQNATMTRLTVAGLRYAIVTCSWTSSTVLPVTVGTAFIQIYINNFQNLGVTWEGPTFPAPVSASATGKGVFTIEQDDGTGGLPAPAGHNVTLYFVSVSQSGVRRPDPTGAPAKVLTGGFSV
jgi:hypothetical protein